MNILDTYSLTQYSIPIYVIIIWHLITLVVPLLISIAYLTLLERKQIAAIQGRKGPNVIGIFGLLQPLADGLKLFTKELLLPNKSNVILFLLAPCITFSLSLISWIILPLCALALNIELGILFILAVSSLAVYGIVIAGWSSNSNYALLGALRSTAQMISYEVSIGLLCIPVILCIGSLNFETIIQYQQDHWNLYHLLPVFILFFISSLAETNRAPFDLPEAEAELVAGYNVEYSGMAFALFFLGEYNNMIIISTIMVFMFLGGWYSGGLLTFFIFVGLFMLIYLKMPWNIDTLFYYIIHVYVIFMCFYFLIDKEFSIIFFNTFGAYNFFFANNPYYFISAGIKIIFLLYLFILTRASLPRYRYDQLMQIGWKMILPFSLVFVTITSTFCWQIDQTLFNIKMDEPMSSEAFKKKLELIETCPHLFN